MSAQVENEIFNFDGIRLASLEGMDQSLDYYKKNAKTYNEVIIYNDIIFRGDGNENCGVKGDNPLEETSVLAHLFTAYGKCQSFSWFSFLFLFFLSYFSSLGGTSLTENIRGDMSPISPPVRHLWLLGSVFRVEWVS